ncbi:hypothetical protein C8J57DRAFT_1185286, partial [Mycena rebaudengoi]
MEKVFTHQLPTHRGVYLSSAHEAHLLFYAVLTGLFPMVQRSLTLTERASIQSGDIFVWEAQDRSVKGPEALRRFMDGLAWDKECHRGDLVYYKRTQGGMVNSLGRLLPQAHAELRRTTYAAFVIIGGVERIFHLNSYYIDADIARLV